MLNIPWFPDRDVLSFPAVEQALDAPDGLLMLGGNLSPTSLQNAYQSGIFPWFEEGQSIMWWSPSVRAVIPTEDIHISKNMRRLIRNHRYQVVADNDFKAVIDACSNRAQTWIVKRMRDAYLQLYDRGMAHSIEVYNKDRLVGGLYGVFVKNCFCGESMFSRESDTSKLALIKLAQFLLKHNSLLIDCQLPTAHLQSMGAIEMSRQDFVAELSEMRDNNLLMNKKWITLWQRL